MQQAGYDIVIIGGGMVGATLAHALRRALPRSMSLAVIEAVDLPDTSLDGWQPSYDARSTALSAGARNIFEQLQLWQAISPQATPITDIHVSDRGHFGITRLHAYEHRVPALGYVVDNSWLGQVLVSSLREDTGVHWLCPMQVRHCTPQPEGSGSAMMLETDDHGEHHRIAAGLVILADGGRSPLGAELGLESDVQHYGQQAIVVNVSPAKPHRNIAYERFTDEGPMAMLPRQNGDCALVWTMPESLAEERLQLVDADFLAELQDRFGYRLGRFQRAGERFSYPLSLKTAREQVRPGLVVLGNAAHSLHPVAGQGFNLCLRDVEELTRVLAQACEQGRRPGHFDDLLRYVELRSKDQQRTIGFSDQVVKLFSNSSTLLAGARNLGLLGLELMYPPREWFARQAMGLG